MVRLEWTFLGTVPYQRALQLQYLHASKVADGAGPRLFLLEHPPTITLGRHSGSSSLKLSEEEYPKKGIEVFRVRRGGDVTYHGPGQLVGYPVASLDSVPCSVPAWVRGHAEAILRFLRGQGVEGAWSDTHPGVWVGRKKVAALGFGLSRRVSTHGFALNLDPDLSYFQTIVPCGLGNLGVTSMAELATTVPPMGQAAAELARLVAETFGWQLGNALDPRRVIEESLDVSSIAALG